ncbi:hypothetical protein CEW81_09425 [Kluyvera genomosp. 3]|uniref:Uncharacterized protein n=1 Tax=Kluyvera genomosp. 3 TaxID=2774055 RepID=A0A248KH85_9ENTR|nr:hypothetical protein CEW81_09425 [Kluyvera genomosp. 3]
MHAEAISISTFIFISQLSLLLNNYARNTSKLTRSFMAKQKWDELVCAIEEHTTQDILTHAGPQALEDSE